LALENANTLFLSNGSHLRIEGKRSLHHRSGQMWADVQKGYGEFEVETNGADVVVLGTSFGVEYHGDDVTVCVTRGKVKVMTKGGAVELGPGETARYSPSVPYLPPKQGRNSDGVSPPTWVQHLDERGRE
jgi:ferric-dicitrate binding protein FerR (iron transport regulator)